MFMVRNTIFNVNISEVSQPLAGKVRALKAPGHFMLSGTLTEAGTALNTRRHYLIREASVTVSFLNRNAVSLGTSF